MGPKLSVYEIIAYTVPGALLIALVLYTDKSLGILQITIDDLNSLSWVPLLFLFVFSYALGIILDRFARLWQHRFFRKHENAQETFQFFKRVHPDLKIYFQPKDWPILLSFLRLRYPNWVVESIEYHNASNIMLRNLSLLSVFLSLIQISLCFESNETLVHLIVAFLALVASVLLGKESARRKRWFYFTLYETITASSLSSDDMVHFERISLSQENS